MNIIKNLAEWQAIRQTLGSKSLGLVPTMGCLHSGHASLISRSVKENEITVLSLFVNPTQFNNPDDYKNYPKTIDQDIEMAEKLKVDYLLLFDEHQLYPDGNIIFFETRHPLALILEGKHRPGHFNGVLSIVMKLLLLTKATRAYFGEKDYQQLVLIKSLVRNYFVDTEIVACPTIREVSGLASSSRNTRLSESQLEVAHRFAKIFLSHDPRDLEGLRKALDELDLEMDYLEVHENRLFIAIKLGEVRLIDNREIE